MANYEDVESKSYFVLRFVNVSRIIFYGIAVWVQLTLLIACYLSSSYCDVFTVIVPLSLIFVDIMVIKWSRNPFKEFLIASLLVCFISFYIAFQTLLPILIFPAIASLEGRIMFFLSMGVGAVSFIELFTLIYLTRPQEDYEEEPWESEVRTYDAQRGAEIE